MLGRGYSHAGNLALHPGCVPSPCVVTLAAHTAAPCLQAVTIIGGGRVGQALADMGPGTDVSGGSLRVVLHPTSQLAAVAVILPTWMGCVPFSVSETSDDDVSARLGRHICADTAPVSWPPPRSPQVVVRRGEAIAGPPGPILVATRNDVLDEIVDRTPADRKQGV